MIDLIATRRSEVAELCRRHHARRLEVFGSAARGDFDPAASDLDFLVEFDPDHRDRAFDDYFDLKEGLEALFGRPVDLVVEKAIRNRYFRAGVDETREAVYESPFHRIEAGLRDALAYTEGRHDGTRFRVHEARDRKPRKLG